MRECEGHLSQAEFDQIIIEFYGETPSFSSNIDSESSSSSFLDTLMEIIGSLLTKRL